jgi:predicted  nucleic acid-binding Zn-ribbon protein
MADDVLAQVKAALDEVAAFQWVAEPGQPSVFRGVVVQGWLRALVARCERAEADLRRERETCRQVEGLLTDSRLDRDAWRNRMERAEADLASIRDALHLDPDTCGTPDMLGTIAGIVNRRKSLQAALAAAHTEIVVLNECLASARTERDAARTELEDERLRLAACMSAALGNTKAAVRERIPRDHPHWSASYGDVCAAVDREIQLRADLAAVDAYVGGLRDEVGELNVRLAGVETERDHYRVALANKSAEVEAAFRAGFVAEDQILPLERAIAIAWADYCAKRERDARADDTWQADVKFPGQGQPR